MVCPLSARSASMPAFRRLCSVHCLAHSQRFIEALPDGPEGRLEREWRELAPGFLGPAHALSGSPPPRQPGPSSLEKSCWVGPGRAVCPDHDERRGGRLACVTTFPFSLGFRRAHTLTVLFILTCALGYVTLLEETPQDTAYNTKRGVVASILVFLCFGVTQAKDGPFSRPHPAYWRFWLCVSVVYELFLIFILFQAVECLAAKASARWRRQDAPETPVLAPRLTGQTAKEGGPRRGGKKCGQEGRAARVRAVPQPSVLRPTPRLRDSRGGVGGGRPSLPQGRVCPSLLCRNRGNSESGGQGSVFGGRLEAGRRSVTCQFGAGGPKE
ncbi:uncharacterized protein LOC123255880 [Gracilinanus agilis]|uniref:uncharacterized protein LOC123255880 n=1 Tax=Gracilinanus agilis TaxID=191870 RepID=UPI001CFD75CF|nr:uncharacterized protein LOC123255880 [Gracilinanus agilis]